MNLLQGLFDLPWWGYVLYVVIVSQITIAAVTLYLHRSQAHLSLDLHPIVSHFFRFWLFMTTGMRTIDWVSIHRKHHAKCETAEDPHSPRHYGIKKVLLEGAELYRVEKNNQETLERYSHGCPTDWIERHLYSPRSTWGIYSLFVINFVLFGFIGITMTAAILIWIPLHAAGGINGIGHYWGYRNYECSDDATNISPWAFWIGGEELHNNHHAYPSSAKFSLRPWEFDIGWMYIKILGFFGLAKARRVAPKPEIDKAKTHLDMDTVRAIFKSKMHVMANYANGVIKPLVADESSLAHQSAEPSKAKTIRQARKPLILEESRMCDHSRAQVDAALQSSEKLMVVYQFRKQLQEIWTQTYSNQEKLVQALADWCKRAEESGIQYLQDFADSLRGYGLKVA